MVKGVMKGSPIKGGTKKTPHPLEPVRAPCVLLVTSLVLYITTNAVRTLDFFVSVNEAIRTSHYQDQGFPVKHQPSLLASLRSHKIFGTMLRSSGFYKSMVLANPLLTHSMGERGCFCV